MLDMDLLNEFATVMLQIKEQKATLKKLATKKEELNSQVVDHLIDNQVDRITVNGQTIHTHTRIALKILSSKKDVIEVLKKSEYKFYVEESFNTTSINALLSEMVNNDIPFPPEFEGHIDYYKIITAKA